MKKTEKTGECNIGRIDQLFCYNIYPYVQDISYISSLRMHGHICHLMLAKSKAKPKTIPTKLTNYFCFKCIFTTTSEKLLDNHMHFIHLIGPKVMSQNLILCS